MRCLKWPPPPPFLPLPFPVVVVVVAVVVAVAAVVAAAVVAAVFSLHAFCSCPEISRVTHAMPLIISLGFHCRCQSHRSSLPICSLTVRTTNPHSQPLHPLQTPNLQHQLAVSVPILGVTIISHQPPVAVPMPSKICLELRSNSTRKLIRLVCFIVTLFSLFVL